MFKKKLVNVFAASLLFQFCNNDNPISVDKNAACYHLNISNNNQQISLNTKDTLEIKLQTIGPCSYGTPKISSSAIYFVKDSAIGPPIPAGPTQLYIFIANTNGEVNITIPHSGNNEVMKIDCIIK